MTPSDIALIHAALSGNPDPEVMRAWERVREHASALEEAKERFMRDALLLLSGHGVPTPERGYGSHGEAYGHVLSDVGRALDARYTWEPWPTPEDAEQAVAL